MLVEALDDGKHRLNWHKIWHPLDIVDWQKVKFGISWDDVFAFMYPKLVAE